MRRHGWSNKSVSINFRLNTLIDLKVCIVIQIVSFPHYDPSGRVSKWLVSKLVNYSTYIDIIGRKSPTNTNCNKNYTATTKTLSLDTY